MTIETDAEIARRAERAEFQLQARFEETGNPIYAWYELWRCFANRHDLSPWLTEYLLDAADQIMKLSRDEISGQADAKLTDEQKLQMAQKALRLRSDGRGNVFGQFAEVESAMQGALTVSVLRELARRKPKRESMATDIANDSAMSKRKVERWLGRARRIRRRAIDLAKNRP
jgi:hypothetical protein